MRFLGALFRGNKRRVSYDIGNVLLVQPNRATLALYAQRLPRTAHPPAATRTEMHATDTTRFSPSTSTPWPSHVNDNTNTTTPLIIYDMLL